ncbi:DUF4286 family protein [soil metagenome]
MVIYEVNLEIDTEVAADYLEWLKPHIRDVLACDGFLDAELFEIETEADSDRLRYSVRYSVLDREALDAYFEGPAQALRADGAQRFSNRFSASRRIMTSRGAFP